MRHLYNSRVDVLRLFEGEFQFGTLTQSYAKLTTVVDPVLGVPGELQCRLDMQWVRPGKDQPVPVQAGRAPDRVGLLFCDYGVDLRAGDRIRPTAGPITGVFEIRVVPDAAVDYSFAHHIEVQIIEVAQSLVGVFPGRTPEEN